jgi:hypothetical protein
MAARKRKRKPAKKPFAVTFGKRDAAKIRAGARELVTTPTRLVKSAALSAATGAAEGALALARSARVVDSEASIEDFARAVNRAARARGVKRFHDDRAYISSVYQYMARRGELGGSVDRFKRRLVEAHQAGLLRITRADLVGAMDRKEVDRSEIQYLNSTFHFVAID